VEHEFDALAELNGILLQGSIDLWFEEGDGRVVLVDYKTDRLWSADRESVYSTQLRLYALILRKLLGRPPHEAWLFRLRDAQAIAVDVTHPALQSAERVIAEFAATAAAGEFDARPGSQCAWCAYAAGACPEPRPAPPESLTA
jgi:RecB family exonuclease